MEACWLSGVGPAGAGVKPICRLGGLSGVEHDRRAIAALLDNAARLTAARLAGAVSEVRVARCVWLSDLAELLGCHPQTRATNRLLAVLADDAPTRSEFERAFVRFARRHWLPEPQVNAPD